MGNLTAVQFFVGIGRSKKNMAELLAPAGDLEKLIFAAHYGADAVYFGLDQFSLRSFAKNFTLEQIQQGLDTLHQQGKRAYCTLNIYPFDHEYDELLEYAQQLEKMSVDAFIDADLGVLSKLKKAGIQTPIHISTQANTLSSDTAIVYHELGASRVNLARELSFDQIAQIQDRVAKTGLDLEVFVHGSVCFSYSGRCAISDYLTGRRANRGECTHPCRWPYHLVEEKRPGEYIPVMEDGRGLYLFNSKDLALFSYISRLSELGISSFKIEGRMKSIHYIASVVSCYRLLMDGNQLSEEEVWLRLNRVQNRGYSQGFMKGSIQPDDYKFDKSNQTSDSLFLANVTERVIPGHSELQVRNKIIGGEDVEVLRPDGSLCHFVLPKTFKNAKDERVEVATYSTIILPFELPPFSIIRKITSGPNTAIDAT